MPCSSITALITTSIIHFNMRKAFTFDEHLIYLPALPSTKESLAIIAFYLFPSFIRLLSNQTSDLNINN